AARPTAHRGGRAGGGGRIRVALHRPGAGWTPAEPAGTGSQNRDRLHGHVRGGTVSEVLLPLWTQAAAGIRSRAARGGGPSRAPGASANAATVTRPSHHDPSSAPRLRVPAPRD